jgi:putative FmdB family regulatory protein
MAIYEYDCPRCGTFEVTQKMADPVLTTHEACGEPIQRRISLSSFALKGGGSQSTRTSASEALPCGGECAGGMCPARAMR